MSGITESVLVRGEKGFVNAVKHELGTTYSVLTLSDLGLKDLFTVFHGFATEDMLKIAEQGLLLISPWGTEEEVFGKQRVKGIIDSPWINPFGFVFIYDRKPPKLDFDLRYYETLSKREIHKLAGITFQVMQRLNSIRG